MGGSAYVGFDDECIIEEIAPPIGIVYSLNPLPPIEPASDELLSEAPPLAYYFRSSPPLLVSWCGRCFDVGVVTGILFDFPHRDTFFDIFLIVQTFMFHQRSSLLPFSVVFHRFLLLPASFFARMTDSMKWIIFQYFLLLNMLWKFF